MLLGAHMSIAGGVSLAIGRAQSVDCEALQIFLKNNNQWRGKPLDDEEVEAFRLAWKQSAVQRIIAHNAYLINLCSPNAGTARLSFDAMLDELARAEVLGIEGIVMHPGAGKDRDEREAISCVVEAVNELIERTAHSRVRLLFECTAGQGSSIGCRFEHLHELIRRTRRKSRIGVCLDTCHLFAAGYDIRTPSAYEQTMSEFDRIVGLKYLRALHLNDSKKPLGSRVDRHAHIGQGLIGAKGFANFINDPRLAQLPGIIETPKGEDLAEDRMNLQTLRDLKGRRRRRVS